MVASLEAVAPSELVRGSVDLVSLPDIVLTVNEMIVNPRYDANDIGSVIGNDAGLTIRLLKIVNSAFYGFKAKIDTVARAITVVGIEDLRNLVLATSAVDTFNKIPQDLVDMTDFWIRSVQRGVIARLLAKKCLVLQPERLFVSGLLSDIGSLLMYSKVPDPCREILLAAGDNLRLVPGLELELLGYTHAEVASELINLWQLPESVREAVSCHLNPETAGDHHMDAHIVYLANRLCEVSIQGYSMDETLAEIPELTFKVLRLDQDQIVDSMSEVAGDFSKVFELIVPNSSFVY